MRGKLARPVREGDTGNRTSPQLAPRPVSYLTIPGITAPADIVARLAGVLVPGSYVAISHLTGDFAPEQVAAATEAYNTCTQVPVTARSHAQVTGLFGGLPLVAPGVVPITQWRPPIGQLPPPADLHAGLGRIPHPAMGGLA